MNQYCQNCSTQLSQDAVFCASCGTRVQPIRKAEPTGHPVLLSQSVQAEDPRPSRPMVYIAESFRGAKASVTAFLKNPKKMVPMLILAGIWLVLSILPAIGFNPWPLKWLSFATFAQGGMFGGFWGALGGIIGKTLFAYFVSALLVPLVMGKATLKGFGDGLKSFLAGFSVQGLHMLPPLLTGIGLALIIFNFLSGNSSFVNSMPGIVGVVLAIRALLRRSGFIWNLLLSVAHKMSRGRIPASATVQRVVSGFAAGSLAGVGLSTLRLPYLPYWLGLILVVAGVVLSMTAKIRKGAMPV